MPQPHRLVHTRLAQLCASPHTSKLTAWTARFSTQSVQLVHVTDELLFRVRALGHLLLSTRTTSASSGAFFLALRSLLFVGVSVLSAAVVLQIDVGTARAAAAVAAAGVAAPRRIRRPRPAARAHATGRGRRRRSGGMRRSRTVVRNRNTILYYDAVVVLCARVWETGTGKRPDAQQSRRSPHLKLTDRITL